jgi:hypothetical protein
VANFKATQQKFQREREEYYATTMEMPGTSRADPHDKSGKLFNPNRRGFSFENIVRTPRTQRPCPLLHFAAIECA